MATLTEREADLLRFINDYTAQHAYPPTIRDMCAGMGWASTNAAHELLTRLQDKGVIARERGRARSIRVLLEERSR